MGGTPSAKRSQRARINHKAQLEVVELDNAKDQTNAMQMAPLPEENPAVQRRQPFLEPDKPQRRAPTGCTTLHTRRMINTLDPTPTWRLADHVRACCVDEQVILLDLHRGRYIGVGGPLVSALPQLIDGWPSVPNAATQDADAAILSEWVETFRGQRMLTEARGHAPTRPTLVEPVGSMNADDDEQPSAFPWRCLLKLWRTAAVTAIWLRRRTLAEIANAVAAAPDRHLQQAAPDAATLRRAVASYMRVRPFAFTAHDRCLHDSLTLKRFLASQGLVSHWVIGVRTRPFGAHSWVQSGGVVLNDQHENVRRYKPILVV